MAADHRAIMVSLAQLHGWTRGVELGLGKGRLLRRLLTECPQLSMIGVDHFQHKADRWRPLVKAVVADFPGRAQVFGVSTVEASSRVQDGYVDFVFVDAGHSYQAVTQDIRGWRSKVKPGGWFGGHDFCDKFPGVQRAVREAFGTAFDQLPCDIWVAR